MTALAAVILAGGRSSRMGHDKALLSVGAEMLIQRTCRVALACTDIVYVITPWPDRYRPHVPDEVMFIAEPCLPGQSGTFQGPMLALITALSILLARSEKAPDWVLALACDMPNLSAAVLGTWRDELPSLAPHYLAYLPTRQQRWEPLCGFYRIAALASLEQYANTGERRGPSLQGWLNQQAIPGQISVSSRFPFLGCRSLYASRIAPIPQVNEAMLTNVNTPEDLAEWQNTRGS
ncbi:molybdenum cofactor guanylyltransferase [Leptolyngbya sp. CCNP1308]|uniref:molybdenum cofactor guanylyltransferase n=1 Tax=Leptolyngbya sp. CCNP1308 TaxID=3110255 RepID=UPI002B1F877E|nr:molybdenum cofactor guanylyltransferase [Leptolyngbya sp. CCNP1308]MEA5450289.1 molybdenum cofactor guanylyltransferase [Leptolyngbya sp. CCNP1308]